MGRLEEATDDEGVEVDGVIMMDGEDIVVGESNERNDEVEQFDDDEDCESCKGGGGLDALTSLDWKKGLGAGDLVFGWEEL